MRTGLLSLLLLSLAFAIVSPRMVSMEGHRAHRCAYFRCNMYVYYFRKGKCHENLEISFFHYSYPTRSCEYDEI
jgi:hypothetical protein